MKKIYTIIIFAFILTGCGNKLNLTDDIISINFDKYPIIEEDYEEIRNILNKIKFYCGKKKNYSGSTLVVSTESTIKNFHISNNYYMEYQNNNKYCYTKDSQKVKNLIFKINNSIEKYTSTSFYNIEFLTDYEENSDDYNIRLDKNNEYIVINNGEAIYNFKINDIEYSNDSFEEINLLYKQELIEPNKIVIRYLVGDNPNYKISFENKYGYLFSIIPTYDGMTGKIDMVTDIKAK